jgi:hypothetical protein
VFRVFREIHPLAPCPDEILLRAHRRAAILDPHHNAVPVPHRVFLRVRTDKTWEEVVADAQKDVDDKASAAPSVRRQPSLMTSVPGSTSAANVGAAASDPDASMEEAVAPAPRPKRSASGSSICRVQAITAAIAARAVQEPPSKRVKAAAAAAVADEPTGTAAGTRTIWSWRSGGGWTAYNDSACCVLEVAHQKKEAAQMGTRGMEPVALDNGYVVDVANMKQWKVSAPSMKRSVRREVKDIVI